MKVIVIGGHTRNIGKTSVMSTLVREFAPLGWTAVKITQYGHGICSRDGRACDCAPSEHPFALTEEPDAAGRSDTCRYLAAGARRSFWLRARQGQLASALPLLWRKLQGAEWVVIESNSILEFIKPLLYLAVVDGSRADFKPSAARALAKADALVTLGWQTIETASDASRWSGIDAGSLAAKLVFPVSKPGFWSPALADFVRDKLAAADHRNRPSFLSQHRSALEQTWPH
ncbi:MAG TPA: hypothetical protein VI455_13725 [Terriglobia bacterium]